MMSTPTPQEQLRQLEAQVEQLRLKREAAERQAAIARYQAEQQALADEQRKAEQAEQDEFRQRQAEFAEKLAKWRSNPFDYAQEKGLWND